MLHELIREDTHEVREHATLMKSILLKSKRKVQRPDCSSELGLQKKRRWAGLQEWNESGKERERGSQGSSCKPWQTKTRTVVCFVFCLFRATLVAYGGSQARSCSCGPIPQSRQCRILNPLSEVRGGTCNLMVPSWIHFRCATMGTPRTVVLTLNMMGNQCRILRRRTENKLQGGKGRRKWWPVRS